MHKEIQSIINNLQQVLNGQPWYGDAVLPMLKKIHPADVYINPKNSHAAIELLYHMITWADYTLKTVQGIEVKEVMDEIPMNWRGIDPKIHTWETAMNDFENIHSTLIKELNIKADAFLNDQVPGRSYNFRFLLNGLIQHNIYHLGQIAFLKNLLGE